ADSCKMLKLGGLMAALMMGSLSTGASAQQTAAVLASDHGLPDAPGRETRIDAPGSEPTPQKSTAISGTVLDTNGAVVTGAQVALTGTVARAALSGSNGEFAFSDLPPGSFRLTVTGTGMGTFVSPE